MDWKARTDLGGAECDQNTLYKILKGPILKALRKEVAMLVKAGLTVVKKDLDFY